MSTPTSFPQLVKAWQQLGEPDSEQVQYLLASGLLADLGAAAGPHLSGVDRSAFKALLAPPPKSIAWTPVNQYADKLRDWNHRFSLGLTEAQISDLAAELPDHAGPHQPTGIGLTLGKNVKDTRKVIHQIIEYELGKLGVVYTDYIGQSNWSVQYLAGSEPPKDRKPRLSVALLDIGTFWDPQNGVVPNQARRQRGRWPGLEVYWLMALNPQVLNAIDYETIPGFIAAGLVVDSDGVPVFRRGSGGAYVSGRWGGGRWRGGAVVVAFREC